MAHTARCNRPESAGRTPASRLRGHGAGPLPSPPPLGEGVRLLPPAGGGWEGGGTRRTMVTAAVHAARAAPRRDEHPSWEGCAPHTLPRARAWRNQVPPSPCAWAAPPTPSHRVGGWGNPVSPAPCVRARPSGGREDGASGPCSQAPCEQRRSGEGFALPGAFEDTLGAEARQGCALPGLRACRGTGREPTYPVWPRRGRPGPPPGGRWARGRASNSRS